MLDEAGLRISQQIWSQKLREFVDKVVVRAVRTGGSSFNRHLLDEG